MPPSERRFLRSVSLQKFSELIHLTSFGLVVFKSELRLVWFAVQILILNLIDFQITPYRTILIHETNIINL